MTYVIKAVLSDSRCPARGQCTIPFPIPDDAYDDMLEMLHGIGIGDAVARDCQIDAVDSFYGVLNSLTGTAVNVDELDYLAKRLDSYCDNESEQFQAMAYKLGLTDIKDFINLTFCCQRATVISDFSKLKEAGEAHRMNLNDGTLSMEELKTLDGRKEALQLIRTGAGTVTPYGVVYDNGMKLEPLYDGQHFPAYVYDQPLLMLEVSSKWEPDAPPEYLYLPAPDSQVERTLSRADVQEASELRQKVEIDELPEQVSSILHLESEGFYDLNALCHSISGLSDEKRGKLEAAVLLAKPEHAGEILRLTKDLDQFSFVPNVQTPEEYGRYMIQKSGRFVYDENLEEFYNFESCGLDRIEHEDGQFTPCGYIAYTGSIPLEELMQPDPAEQAQRGPQIGGLSQ